MVLDTLENADAYNALNSGFAKAFEFLRRNDLAQLDEGRHEIDGERVYAYFTDPELMVRWKGITATLDA